MRVAGHENGFRRSYRLVDAKNANVVGSSNRFTLEDVPTVDGDMVFHVLSFTVVCPQVRVAAGAQAEPNNYIDALGILANMQVRLMTAGNSPFAAMGVRAILDNVSFAGLEALCYVSGKPVIENIFRDQPLTDTNDTWQTSVVSQVANANAWLSRQRPLVVSDPAGANTDFVPVLKLPIGYRVGEGDGMLPIPAAYFTGKGCYGECGKGDPGLLEWSFRTSLVQNDAFSQLGSTYSVYVEGIWKHKSSMKAVPGLAIQEAGYGTQRQAMVTIPGAHAYTVLRGEVQTDGDETGIATTDLTARIGNRDYVPTQLDTRIVQLRDSEHRPGWRITGANITNAINTPLGCVRLVDPAQDCIFLEGMSSILDMPGSDTEPLTVKLDSAPTGNATQFNLISAVYQCRNAASDRAHNDLYRIPGAVLVSPPTTAPASGAALPAKQVSAVDPGFDTKKAT